MSATAIQGSSFIAPSGRPPSARRVAPDKVTLGETPVTVPGFSQFGVVPIKPQELVTAAGRQAISARMAQQLKKFPALTAVVGTAPDGHGNTELLVQGRPKGIKATSLQGEYEIIERLASSETVRRQAAAYPSAMQPIHKIARRTDEITLGGAQTMADVAAELKEGGHVGTDDQLRAVLAQLPQGQRVVVNVPGPSGAGKSGVIADLQRLAPGRPIVHYTGDNYYRDANDPALPKTAAGTVDWDSPQAEHLDQFGANLVKAVKTGHADEPVYDFSARPSPDFPTAGMRTNQTTSLDAPQDAIIVVDSLFAMDKSLLGKLQQEGVPFVNVYLDSATPTVRLVRRLVRDSQDRGRDPMETVGDWDHSTFPGEVKNVRPQLRGLVIGRDLFDIRQFAADVNLTEPEIMQKLAVQKAYGVQPTYAAFKVEDANMPAFARSEAVRLQGIIDDAKSTNDARQAAQKALLALQQAPQH